MKKYEFTGEEKVVGSVTLKRIKAIRDFENVSSGDIGGWIESEENLSQSNDAQVFGNAQVCGNAQVSITPIVVEGLKYRIVIDDKYVRAGCQQHTVEQWKAFDNRDLLEMDGRDAVKFYPTLIAIIDTLAVPHQER